MYEAWLAAVLSQRSTNPQGGLKVALHFAGEGFAEDACVGLRWGTRAVCWRLVASSREWFGPCLSPPLVQRAAAFFATR